MFDVAFPFWPFLPVCAVILPHRPLILHSTPPFVSSQGSYSTAGATSCVQCPAGSACPSLTSPAAVYPCPPGTYSLPSATACTACPAGSACPFTDAAVVQACTPGSYSNGSQTACTQCPAGYACPSTTGLGITPCSPGSYALGGSPSCRTCPAGFYCPSTTSDVILPCAAGTYALAGAAACIPCPAGYEVRHSTSIQLVFSFVLVHSNLPWRNMRRLYMTLTSLVSPWSLLSMQYYLHLFSLFLTSGTSMACPSWLSRLLCSVL